MKFGLVDCATLDRGTLMTTMCPDFAASGPGQVQRKYLDLRDSGIDPGAPASVFLVTVDGVGFRRQYSSGCRFTGRRTLVPDEVHGAIRNEWESLGWEHSVLGYPNNLRR